VQSVLLSCRIMPPPFPARLSLDSLHGPIEYLTRYLTLGVLYLSGDAAVISVRCQTSGHGGEDADADAVPATSPLAFIVGENRVPLVLGCSMLQRMAWLSIFAPLSKFTYKLPFPRLPSLPPLSRSPPRRARHNHPFRYLAKKSLVNQRPPQIEPLQH
jgi:hypothetical protein